MTHATFRVKAVCTIMSPSDCPFSNSQEPERQYECVNMSFCYAKRIKRFGESSIE